MKLNLERLLKILMSCVNCSMPVRDVKDDPNNVSTRYIRNHLLLCIPLYLFILFFTKVLTCGCTYLCMRDRVMPATSSPPDDRLSWMPVQAHYTYESRTGLAGAIRAQRVAWFLLHQASPLEETAAAAAGGSRVSARRPRRGSSQMEFPRPALVRTS